LALFDVDYSKSPYLSELSRNLADGVIGKDGKISDMRSGGELPNIYLVHVDKYG